MACNYCQQVSREEVRLGCVWGAFGVCDGVVDFASHHGLHDGNRKVSGLRYSYAKKLPKSHEEAPYWPW